jgi:hypothetical protein
MFLSQNGWSSGTLYWGDRTEQGDAGWACSTHGFLDSNVRFALNANYSLGA